VPVYRDEGVVLRTHKLGEADRIVTLLTRSHGKVRAVAKGVRRTGSKFGARLEPFMVADLQLYEGRSLDVINQAETLASYGALIAADYSAYTAATVMVETADKLTESEGSLQQYLLRALSLAGWAPSFFDCARCQAPGPHNHTVVQLGGVVCDQCAPPGSPRLDAQTIGLLSSLLTGDWDHAEASDEDTRARASGVAAAYTQWHLERGLKSLIHVSREKADT
jgi:DNA repair protein RecO (recombination protein O)